MLIQNLKELCFENYIQKSRVLCLDYGDKRVGVAVSDIGWTIASPLKVLESHGIFRSDFFEILNEYEVSFIIIGAPKSLNGGESGLQYEKVKKFVCKLEELFRTKNLLINILFWDERLSTCAANRFLCESEMSFANKKKNIDKVAASFILQGFLDYVEFKKFQKN